MPVARSARTDTTLVDRLPAGKMRFSLALVGLLAEYELEAYPARRGIVGIFYNGAPPDRSSTSGGRQGRRLLAVTPPT